jgi:hypothetical protein
MFYRFLTDKSTDQGLHYYKLSFGPPFYGFGRGTSILFLTEGWCGGNKNIWLLKTVLTVVVYWSISTGNIKRLYADS